MSCFWKLIIFILQMHLHSFCFVASSLYLYISLYARLYFISSELFSKQNTIFRKIMERGAIFKRSACRRAILQKRLKTTALGSFLKDHLLFLLFTKSAAPGHCPPLMSGTWQHVQSFYVIACTGCFTIVETKRQLLKPLPMTLFIFLFPDCHREIVNLSIY